MAPFFVAALLAGLVPMTALGAPAADDGRSGIGPPDIPSPPKSRSDYFRLAVKPKFRIECDRLIDTRDLASPDAEIESELVYVREEAIMNQRIAVVPRSQTEFTAAYLTSEGALDGPTYQHLEFNTSEGQILRAHLPDFTNSPYSVLPLYLGAAIQIEPSASKPGEFATNSEHTMLLGRQEAGATPKTERRFYRCSAEYADDETGHRHKGRYLEWGRKQEACDGPASDSVNSLSKRPADQDCVEVEVSIELLYQ